MANIEKGMMFEECKSEIQALAQNNVEEKQEILGKITFDSCLIDQDSNTNLISVNKLNNSISKINQSPYIYNFDKAKEELQNVYEYYRWGTGSIITKQVGYYSKRFDKDEEKNYHRIINLEVDVNEQYFFIFGEIVPEEVYDMSKCNCEFTNLTLSLIETYEDNTKKTYELYHQDFLKVTKLQLCETYNLGIFNNNMNVFKINQGVRQYQLEITCDKIAPEYTTIGGNRGYIIIYYSKQIPKQEIPEVSFSE